MIPALGLLFCVLCYVPLWPMLRARPDHPRYVAPAVVADVPNVTYSGGLL